MRKLATYLIIAAASLAVAGCGGRKAVVDEAEVEVETVETVEGLAGADGASASALDDADTDSEALGDSATGGGVSAAAVAADRGDDPLLAERVVYFEYDSSRLSDQAKAVVRAHARNLVLNPGGQLILEGHADERGTREYNLALGEDRAKSVADLMQAEGVRISRIQAISYGEERPVALGHDESAWGLNRRVEILYQ